MPHTDIKSSSKATRSLYVAFFLLAATSLFKNEIVVNPQMELRGLHGRGPVDYALESRRTRQAVSVTEVKKENLDYGVAQNMVQLEACLVCMIELRTSDFFRRSS